MLFIMLDKGPNRAHVGEDNCSLRVPYVTYFALENMLGNILKTLETHWEIEGNTMGTFRKLGRNTLLIPIEKIKLKSI